MLRFNYNNILQLFKNNKPVSLIRVHCFLIFHLLSFPPTICCDEGNVIVVGVI